jgi:hypothetical protein
MDGLLRLMPLQAYRAVYSISLSKSSSSITLDGPLRTIRLDYNGWTASFDADPSSPDCTAGF